MISFRGTHLKVSSLKFKANLDGETLGQLCMEMFSHVGLCGRALELDCLPLNPCSAICKPYVSASK